MSAELIILARGQKCRVAALRNRQMNTEARTLTELLNQARKTLGYHVEGAILEFTEELARLMAQEGVSRAEFAKRLGCQPAYVTKLLSGQNNFTIETMVKVARALNAQLKLHLQATGVHSVGHPREARQTAQAQPACPPKGQ